MLRCNTFIRSTVARLRDQRLESETPIEAVSKALSKAFRTRADRSIFFSQCSSPSDMPRLRADVLHRMRLQLSGHALQASARRNSSFCDLRFPSPKPISRYALIVFAAHSAAGTNPVRRHQPSKTSGSQLVTAVVAFVALVGCCYHAFPLEDEAPPVSSMARPHASWHIVCNRQPLVGAVGSVEAHGTDPPTDRRVNRSRRLQEIQSLDARDELAYLRSPASAGRSCNMRHGTHHAMQSNKTYASTLHIKLEPRMMRM